MANIRRYTDRPQVYRIAAYRFDARTSFYALSKYIDTQIDVLLHDLVSYFSRVWIGGAENSVGSSATYSMDSIKKNMMSEFFISL